MRELLKLYLTKKRSLIREVVAMRELTVVYAE